MIIVPITIIPIKIKTHLGTIIDIEPDGEAIVETNNNRAIFAMRRLMENKKSFGVFIE